VGEQFERILKSFDPVTQELYRLFPAMIHTQSGNENLKQKSKREEHERDGSSNADPANQKNDQSDDL
jgi:hypothetical protein